MNQQNETKNETNRPVKATIEDIFRKIQSGEIWIETKRGMVNAATDPVEFDAAITEHVEIPDRVKWPLADRALMLEKISGLPFYEISLNDLPIDLKKQYEELKKRGLIKQMHVVENSE